MDVLPFPQCVAGGLTPAEMVALVNGLLGGHYGNFVLVDGTGREAQDRLWLRCYNRTGSTALSFGFNRHARRIRVIVKGLTVR